MNNIKKSCSKCSKQFLVIPQEQNFLNKIGLPLPNKCPGCRQLRRLSKRGERSLFETKCQQCNKNIIVSYDPQKTNRTILCKECYLKYFETTNIMRQENEP